MPFAVHTTLFLSKKYPHATEFFWSLLFNSLLIFWALGCVRWDVFFSSAVSQFLSSFSLLSHSHFWRTGVYSCSRTNISTCASVIQMVVTLFQPHEWFGTGLLYYNHYYNYYIISQYLCLSFYHPALCKINKLTNKYCTLNAQLIIYTTISGNQWAPLGGLAEIARSLTFLATFRKKGNLILTEFGQGGRCWRERLSSGLQSKPDCLYRWMQRCPSVWDPDERRIQQLRKPDSEKSYLQVNCHSYHSCQLP